MAASCAPLLSGQIVYVGTYTRTSSKGIYACGFNPPPQADAARAGRGNQQPTFLAVHPTSGFLYAANEDKVGTSARSPSTRKRPVEAAEQRAVARLGAVSRGRCSNGKWVFAANYNSGKRGRVSGA